MLQYSLHMGWDIFLKVNDKKYLIIFLVLILQSIILYGFDFNVISIQYFIAIFFTYLLLFQFFKKFLNPINNVYENFDLMYLKIIKNKKTHSNLDDVSNSLNELNEFIENQMHNIENLEKYRSQFLGNVSHELKTPIFTLQGYIDTLMDGAIDDKAVNKTFLSKIKKQSERIENLLTDLIKISMIESNEMKLEINRTELSTILDEVKDKYLPILKNRGDNLLVPDTKSVFVDVDKNNILSVFDNLITNAINYSDNGDIIISVKYNKGNVIISITDHGVGITKEHQKRIFERFYRIDSNRSREYGGTGLGLSIVKHILLSHDSDISIESNQNIGSTFSFKLTSSNS